MRTLDAIQEHVNEGSAKVVSYDARLTCELLWEILQRMDGLLFAVYSEIEILDHCLRVNVTVAQTLLYQNNTNKPVTLKLYNTDPAQTVFIGKNGVTIIGPGIPLFTERDMRVTVSPGDSIFGIVELGTVDVRYSVFVYS
jgi:hypothetical protein